MEFQLDEVSVAQQFYITTKAARAEDRPRVLKYGSLFALFDRYGDIEPFGLGEEGLFYDGTRFLSELVLYIGKSRPLFLSSNISRDNFLFTADLTNVDILDEDEVAIPRGTVHVARSKFLWRGVCYEKFRICNYGLSLVSVPLRLTFNADFADIFEVRGTRRERRGERLQASPQSDSVVLAYRGLDGVVRQSCIHCMPPPTRLSSSEVVFGATLHPKQELNFHLIVSCDPATPDAPADWDSAFSVAKQELKADSPGSWRIQSSNDQFNDWIGRSVADLQMMIHGNPETGYPYAGVPWFSTVFGRDGIITALECLWLAPSMAKGVLEFLAAHQATEMDESSDVEPGKILHEMRKGEMAALGEVPFGLYYGSVDSTPLFVMLSAAYYARTGDLEFMRSLWPHIEAALDWIDKFGDSDGDGFVEYSRHSPSGLVQQGWKDSSDSVFHADGRIAEAPIALCEVQGYVFAAKRGAAIVAAAMGDTDRSAELDYQAKSLQARFEDAFWCDELETYALALDGRKRQCRVRTSNAGHCLYTRIAGSEKARLVAQGLLGADQFSGWGVRTVDCRESRYNPISYHNGSVWPHDNALIASGLSKYGFKDLVSRIFSGLLDVSVVVDLHRLPELFCGLHRRADEGPTLYPVACSPQAWAAGAVFMLLESCLGISIEGQRKQINFENPQLPESVTQLWLKGLDVTGSRVDLFLERHHGGVRVHVLENPANIAVTTQPTAAQAQ
jgi:glycogen debranching enzyme